MALEWASEMVLKTGKFFFFLFFFFFFILFFSFPRFGAL